MGEYQSFFFCGAHAPHTAGADLPHVCVGHRYGTLSRRLCSRLLGLPVLWGTGRHTWAAGTSRDALAANANWESTSRLVGNHDNRELVGITHTAVSALRKLLPRSVSSAGLPLRQPINPSYTEAAGKGQMPLRASLGEARHQIPCLTIALFDMRSQSHLSGHHHRGRF